MSSTSYRAAQEQDRSDQLASLVAKGNQLHDQAVIDLIVNMVSAAMLRVRKPFSTHGRPMGGDHHHTGMAARHTPRLAA